MKKFAIILLVVFFSSISLAHIGHYNKFDKIEMEILRNDEVIGYNNYYFKRDGEKTIVKNQYKFEVKLLSATIFKVEGYGEEIYLKDNLISFQSKTLQNKKEKFVNFKQYETDHFKLTSKDMSLPEDKKLNFDIWLDKKTSVIVKITYERMGNWEYRLKNLE